MAVTCTPTALMDSAKCFVCLTDSQLLALQTYLLAVKVGGSTDPATLVNQAKCFICLDDQKLLAIQAYLLCQLVNA